MMISGSSYPKNIYGMSQNDLEVQNKFEFEFKFKFELNKKRKTKRKEKKKKKRRSQMGWSRAEAHLLSPWPKQASPPCWRGKNQKRKNGLSPTGPGPLASSFSS